MTHSSCSGGSSEVGCSPAGGRVVCTVENVFLMGQQLPPARARGVGVMREIVLCYWVWPISPVNEDSLLPTVGAFIVWIPGS